MVSSVLWRPLDQRIRLVGPAAAIDGTGADGRRRRGCVQEWNRRAGNGYPRLRVERGFDRAQCRTPRAVGGRTGRLTRALGGLFQLARRQGQRAGRVHFCPVPRSRAFDRVSATLAPVRAIPIGRELSIRGIVRVRSIVSLRFFTEERAGE